MCVCVNVGVGVGWGGGMLNFFYTGVLINKI